MHEVEREKTEECFTAASQIIHPVITSQSFVTPLPMCGCLRSGVGGFVWTVDSVSGAVGAQRQWHWLPETKPDCLNYGLRCPESCLMRETKEQRLEVGRGCQKEARTTKSRRETSKDTKAFAKNGAKTNYFWTQKIEGRCEL